MALSDQIETAIVLDNNPGFRSEVSNMLKSMGIEVLRPSGSGKQGYKEIASSRVRCDLVIANINLDDITAIQFMSALRKNNRFKGTHVLVGVTDDLKSNIEDALGFGLSGYFTKPISIEHLQEYLVSLFSVCNDYGGNELALFNQCASKFFEENKSYKSAVTYLEENLKIGECGRTYFLLGRLQAKLQNKEKAKQFFQQAIEVDASLKGEIKEFTEGFQFEEDSSQDPEVAQDEALRMLGVPFAEISGGFFGQEVMSSAVVVSASFDDNATMRNILLGAGFADVHVHAKGRDAFEEIKSKRIDLAVLSLQLEDMNALQMIDIVRKDQDLKKTRLMLYLEQGFTSNLEPAYELGLDGYFLKPYSSNSIKEALHNMMVHEGVTATADPETKRLVKSSLAHFGIGDYDKGIELAERATNGEEVPGVASLALAMNAQGKGDEEAAQEAYEKLEEAAGEIASAAVVVKEAVVNQPSAEVEDQVEQEQGGSYRGGSRKQERPAYSIGSEEDDEPDLEDIAASDGPGAPRSKKDERPAYLLESSGAANKQGDTGYEIDPQVPIKKSKKKISMSTSEVNAAKAGSSTLEEDISFDEPDFELDESKLKSMPEIDIDSSLGLSLDGKKETKRPAGKKRPQVAASSPPKVAKAAKPSFLKSILPASVTRNDPSELSDESMDVDIDDSLFDLDGSLKRKPDLDLDGGLQLKAGGLAPKDERRSTKAKKKENPTGPSEAVFSAAPKKNSAGVASASFLDIGVPTVNRWVPPEVLQKMEVPPEDRIGSVKLETEHEKQAWLENVGAYGGNFKGLVEQAQLFHGRILWAPDDETPPQGLNDYLSSLGKVLKTQQDAGHISVTDKKVAGKIKKLGKAMAKSPDDESIQIELGRLFMESGAVDELFDRVHAHWEMDDKIAKGQLGQAVQEALRNGGGPKLLERTLEAGVAGDLLGAIRDSGGGIRILEAALETGGGLMFLEKHVEDKGGIKFLANEVKQGGGVKFLDDVIREGKGVKFVEDLIEKGGGIKILESAVKSVEAMNTLGTVLKNSGQAQFVSDDIQSMSAAISVLRDPIAKLHEEFWEGRKRSESILNQALANMENPDFSVGREDFDDALSADNYNLETFKNIYAKLKEEGLNDIGEDFYKHNLKHYKDHAAAHIVLGKNLQKIGEDEKAVDAFEVALKKDEGNYEYLKNLAIAALKMGEYRTTNKWCRKMIRVEPKNSDAYNIMGINCKKHKKYKQSIKHYIKGIKVDPENLKLHHNLAIAYAQIGQDDRSKKMFRRAKELKKRLRANQAARAQAQSFDKAS